MLAVFKLIEYTFLFTTAQTECILVVYFEISEYNKQVTIYIKNIYLKILGKALHPDSACRSTPDMLHAVVMVQ